LHHLKILENAGYVRRVDDGRKWIYYELTDSGKFLVRWRKVKVILPVIGVIAATITAITAILFKPEKEIPEYPAMGADLTWLLVLIVISMFTVSLVVIYLLKRARFKKS
jgi:DNA-binding transcriptional ArsR family regulator